MKTNQTKRQNIFLFHRRYFDAIKKLHEPEQLIIYQAIAEYLLNSKEIKLTETAKPVFNMIKTGLDADNQRLKIVKQTTKGKKTPVFYSEFLFFKDEFKEIWFDEFIPIKKKKKAATTERALISQLKRIGKLSGNNYNTALTILEKTVNSGWTDFYPIKNDLEIKKNEPVYNIKRH